MDKRNITRPHCWWNTRMCLLASFFFLLSFSFPNQNFSSWLCRLSANSNWLLLRILKVSRYGMVVFTCVWSSFFKDIGNISNPIKSNSMSKFHMLLLKRTKNHWKTSIESIIIRLSLNYCSQHKANPFYKKNNLLRDFVKISLVLRQVWNFD